MKTDKKFVFMIVFTCLVSLKEGSKYDSRYNIPDIEAERPFRMKKMNLIWEKANRSKRLDERQLAQLFSDLVILDKKERELKQMKTEGADKDGLHEASVRRELNDLLKRYKLLHHFPEDKYKPDKGFKTDAYPLEGERLKSLLNKAKTEGFSDDELYTLQEELGHYQMKLDEFSALRDEYHEQYETADNSLEHLDEQEELRRELEEKNKNLKQRHKVLQDDMKKLQLKAKKNTTEFEDPRVIQLWTLAQKSGMDDKELDSIKKELHHFENRIKKVEFMKDQMKQSREKIQMLGEHSDDKFLKKQKDMLEKATHFEKLVEKHHRDIKDKIQKRLDEL